jgi:hypothetical protein
MTITLEEVYTLEEILNYKIIGPLERATMQNFVTKFIDQKANICGHCSAQLRFWHSQIVLWADANAQMINDVKNPPKKRGRKPKTQE